MIPSMSRAAVFLGNSSRRVGKSVGGGGEKPFSIIPKGVIECDAFLMGETYIIS